MNKPISTRTSEPSPDHPVIAQHHRSDQKGGSDGQLSTGFLLGFLLIEFLFLILALGNVQLAAGRPISHLTWPVSLGLTIITIPAFLLRGYVDFIRALGLAIISLLFVAMAVILAGSFYDVSWDGQTYHQEAIIRLSQGWNPFFTELKNLYNVQMRALEAAINFYPKGPWITAAAFNLFFHDVETGKAIFWLLAAAAALVSFSWLKNDLGLSRITAGALVAAMLLSPVAVSQGFSYYVDGQMYYLLVIILVCLAIALQPGRTPWIIYPLFLMSVSLALNTKIPAIAFIGILLTAFITFSLIRMLLQRKKGLVAPVILFSIGALFGLMVMGFHPYVTNTLEKGNPLYPVVGEDKIISIQHTRPDDFKAMHRFEMFYRSVFGWSDNPPYHDESESRLKIPFKLHWPQEAQVFQIPDTRTGGFGPLFSGILLLSALLAVAIGLAQRRGRQLGMAAGIGAVLTVSALIHPEAWWARYIPQFYLIPIVFAIFLSRLPGLIPRTSVFLISGMLIVNGLAAAVFYYPYVAEKTRKIDLQLDELESRRHNEVNFLEFRSNRARLEQRSIPYVELTASGGYHCSSVEYFPVSRAFVCIDRKGTLAEGALGCTNQDLLVIWKYLPRTKQLDLIDEGACLEPTTDLLGRIELRQGDYVQVSLQLEDGNEKLLWTWERMLPDPTAGTIP